ncbi:unnamed protein product, partial [Linum tenue]
MIDRRMMSLADFRRRRVQQPNTFLGARRRRKEAVGDKGEVTPAGGEKGFKSGNLCYGVHDEFDSENRLPVIVK